MAEVKPETSSVVEIKNYPASLIHKHKSEDRDELGPFCSDCMTNGALAYYLPEQYLRAQLERVKVLMGVLTLHWAIPNR